MFVADQTAGREGAQEAGLALSRPRAFEGAGLAAASELLRALGSPHRLSIVLELSRGPRCVHELVEHLDISQSLTSQHLRVLRSLGLVIGRRRGKETAYALADEHVAHIARDALAHGSEGGPARYSPAYEIAGNTNNTKGTSPMTMTHETHETHADHDHTHGDSCGHAAVAHEQHTDFLHEGHAHHAHEGHWDECSPELHVVHQEHDHVHGQGCGHEVVAHGDHDDYVHGEHRHAAHEGHWDEH